MYNKKTVISIATLNLLLVSSSGYPFSTHEGELITNAVKV